jgi:hypothetical protein
MYDVLLKIFKKKIKRARKGGMEGEGGDDYNSEDEDEDEDEMDSEDEMDDEDEEVCPPGCDPALYEKVCELREKRLEQEDSEFQKGVEQLKKENETLIKKEKAIDKALLDTEKDIQTFQTDKQRKLNELHVMITLKMSQVHHLVEGKLPADLSSSLVFPAAELDRLGGRIKELQAEKADLRKRQKVLRTEHKQLHANQSAKEEKLRELDARACDVQMLKFGQVVDLDAIESVGVNKGAEDLKERIKRVEVSQDRALQAMQAKLKRAKLELKRATDQSSASLNAVANLFEQQHQLEGSLNQKQQQKVAPREVRAREVPPGAAVRPAVPPPTAYRAPYRTLHTATAHRHTATPPHRHTATPPHRHTATPPSRTPPHRHTATPPHRHTATPPHRHTAPRADDSHTATAPPISHRLPRAPQPTLERSERNSLVQLVKIQAKEVEALKLEINMLRRKGGHVYTGGK